MGSEEVTRVRTSLEMALEEEKETTKTLQKRLAQKQSEYEEKTRDIHDIEEQIHTYRVRTCFCLLISESCA